MHKPILCQHNRQKESSLRFKPHGAQSSEISTINRPRHVRVFAQQAKLGILLPSFPVFFRTPGTQCRLDQRIRFGHSDVQEVKERSHLCSLPWCGQSLGLPDCPQNFGGAS